MWNRQEIKRRGMSSFRGNYWKSVIAAFFYTLFFAGTGASTRYSTSSEELKEEIGSIFSGMGEAEIFAILAIVFAAIGVVMVLWTLIDIFVLNPLEVGCQRFFIENQHDQQTGLDRITYAFRNGYLSVVGGLFLRNLFLSLWYCLLIVPGIVMTYAYRLVPYILAEEPQIGAMEAIRRSKEMMRGHKWDTFVYDLSFIGWYLLTAITAGIAGLFWVNPYKMNADAVLYETIKNGGRT